MDEKNSGGEIIFRRQNRASKLAEKIYNSDPLANIAMEIRKLDQLELDVANRSDTELANRGVQFRAKFLQRNIFQRLDFYNSQIRKLVPDVASVTLNEKSDIDEQDAQITAISLRVIEGPKSKS